jgi:hypothetical protein
MSVTVVALTCEWYTNDIFPNCENYNGIFPSIPQWWSTANTACTKYGQASGTSLKRSILFTLQSSVHPPSAQDHPIVQMIYDWFEFSVHLNRALGHGPPDGRRAVRSTAEVKCTVADITSTVVLKKVEKNPVATSDMLHATWWRKIRNIQKQHPQHSKITPATSRSTFATYNMEKNHVATSTHVTCNMEQNSATFKNNICNIEI